MVQGEAAVQAGNWPEAEGFFLRAKQPEAALAMYKKARLWEEALRIAEDYLPDRVRHSQPELITHCSGKQGLAPACAQFNSDVMMFTS